MKIPTKREKFVSFGSVAVGDVFWHGLYMYIRIAKRNQMYVTGTLRGADLVRVNSFSLSTNVPVEFDDAINVEIANVRIEEIEG